MRLFKEWCRQVNRRQGLMVDLPTLANICKSYDPGYATVYMFEERDALDIKASQCSRGLDRYKVWADCLAIDLDGGDEQLETTEKRLTESGLAYEVWSSGGKGYHVLIPHPLIGSEHLPYSHKKAVEAIGVPHDPTLYQHGRLISLPGRVHPRTGRKKAWVKKVEGKELEIRIVEKPTPHFSFAPNGGLGNLQAAFYKALDAATNEPSLGLRHTRLFAIANDLHNAGLSFDTIKELITAINDQWENPKSEADVLDAIQGGIRWRGGG